MIQETAWAIRDALRIAQDHLWEWEGAYRDGLREALRMAEEMKDEAMAKALEERLNR